MSSPLTAKCKGQTASGKQCSREVKCADGQYCWQHQHVKKVHTPIKTVVPKFPVEVTSAELGKMSVYVKPPEVKFSYNSWTSYGHPIDTHKPVIIFVDDEGEAKLDSIEVNDQPIAIEKYINIGYITDNTDIRIRAWIGGYPFTFKIIPPDGERSYEIEDYYSQNDDFPDTEFPYIANATTVLTIGPKYNLINLTMDGGGG
jgi:hypothetical protein